MSTGIEAVREHYSKSDQRALRHLLRSLEQVLTVDEEVLDVQHSQEILRGRVLLVATAQRIVVATRNEGRAIPYDEVARFEHSSQDGGVGPLRVHVHLNSGDAVNVGQHTLANAERIARWRSPAQVEESTKQAEERRQRAAAAAPSQAERKEAEGRAKSAAAAEAAKDRSSWAARRRLADTHPIRQFEYTWHMWMGSRGYLGPGSVGDISVFNDLGRKGWELVAMYDRVVLFKREVPQLAAHERPDASAGTIDQRPHESTPGTTPVETEFADNDTAALTADADRLYDVVLTSPGDNKLKVIKTLRGSIRGLGLKEAMDIVDGAPIVVAHGLDLDAAEKLARDLDANGASVDLI